MRTRTSLLALTLTLALAAPATGAWQVDSGPLSVRVTERPFALEVLDRADGDRFRSAATAPGSPYGPLGYSFDLRIPIVGNAYLGYYAAAEIPTVWFHARSVRGARRDGDALVLDLETDDPLGHRLEARIAPGADGVVRLTTRMLPGSGPLAGRATVSGAAFAAVAGERQLGFGERSNAVDQTGNKVFNWAEEGPFSSGVAEPLLRPLIPQFTFPTGPTASNFPIPWMVSTRGLGLLIEQTERSTFHLGDERRDAWRAEAESARLALAFVAGPDPADAVRRYSSLAGRQPPPRRWFFGPWVQFKDPWPERFRRLDVPATVAQTYTHYLPCGVHRGREAAERARVRRHHALGYKITTYFNPHICTKYASVYDDAARRGLLVRNQGGTPYLLTNPFTADQVVSEIDFTHPGGRALFGRLLDEAIDAGYDGWMEDFGEYTPVDARFADGRGGAELHNLYPVLYHAASHRHTASRGGDFAAFVRSGFHGAQRHARIVWGGDPTEDWSCSDGLCAAVHQALSTGLSGIAYQGSDIGGFHAIANPRTSDELNARWLEFGALSGIMRTQANGLGISPTSKRSQVWNPQVLPIWRRWAKLRTQLYPYISAASKTYQRTGMPITRHHALTHPGDPSAVREQTQFMFGPDLLAAPVVKPGARSRSLWLPAGRWIDLWRSATYDARTGGVRLGRARSLNGGRRVTLPAPLDELPLLARAGALIPLLPPGVDTLADEGSAAGLVHLRERRYRLHVLAFPRGSSRAALGTGVRARSAERRGEWALSLRSVRRKRHAIRLQASFATLRRPFRPCRVTLRGRPLARRLWRYDRSSRVLVARFAVRTGALVAHRCGRPGKRSEASVRSVRLGFAPE